MRLAACLTLTALLLATAPAMAQKTKNLSYIDRVDQSDPNEVVETFTEAMAADDYFAAYYLLSPTAKDGAYFALASGQMQTLLPGVDPMHLEGMALADRSLPPILQADLTEGAQVFDDLMQFGLSKGHLPFSFEGAHVVSVEPTEWGGEAKVEVSEGPSPLTLELQKAEWGDWRIHKITWDGSAEGQPWNAGSSAALPPAELPGSPRTYLDTLPVSPEAVAETFIQAFGAGDFFRAHLMMSPAAKGAILDQKRPLMMMQFLPDLDTTDVPGTGLFRDIDRADALALDVMRDPGVIMQRLLSAAKRQGALPFDLRNAMIKDVGDITETPDAESGVTAEALITVTTESEPKELTLHMVELPNRQWRVDRISWDGSLEQGRPWGIPV